MVDAIRIHTVIESETLRIPELARFIGKRVEVIVLEDDSPSAGGPSPGTFMEPGAPSEKILGSLRGRLQVPDDFDDPLPATEHDQKKLTALRAAIDEGEASGIAKGDSFARVRAQLGIGQR